MKLISENAIKFDFESLYQQYPRKIGKQSGMRRLNSRIKSESQFLAFKKALTNYLAHLEINAAEKRFVKHWSTFVNQYEDWIDYEPEDETQKLKNVNNQKENKFCQACQNTGLVQVDERTMARCPECRKR